ncbi:hypothetical protein [Bradyrhizobium retamae]|uniref:Uncharacterized protein n=1 Tax=Bradyrhizobium retamae TaxID=1300035 RepID=A0A0R3MGN8_9BRAD|nr:hypothetical protein [Bradyrhizobium retamae]KRR19249.1 hypothetical protein CQ13_34015 [Bradyrhizobium retamae]
MASAQMLGQRWREYRPSKAALFWSCVGSVVVALIIGFTWGGWVTGGTAKEMVDKAARDARAELAANVCVQRFVDASDARAQLATLKKTSSWQREDFIEKGGWATLPGSDKPVASAAEICAERLAAMKLPPVDQGAQSGERRTSIE